MLSFKRGNRGFGYAGAFVGNAGLNVALDGGRVDRVLGNWRDTPGFEGDGWREVGRVRLLEGYLNLRGLGETPGRPIVRACGLEGSRITTVRQVVVRTVPGVLFAKRSWVRWIVPGPVDEPGFFFGVRSARRAVDKRSR